MKNLRFKRTLRGDISSSGDGPRRFRCDACLRIDTSFDVLWGLPIPNGWRGGRSDSPPAISLGMDTMESRLFADVCSPQRLYSAWRYLRKGARVSQWDHILREYHAIEFDPLGFVNKLSERLKSGNFAFDLKLGYTKRKSGGSRRGIVVASISDRMVQRSILTSITEPSDETQDLVRTLHSVVFSHTSMAGAPGKSVGEAVYLAHQTMKGGATHFLCSDVKSFYPHIPRKRISETVRSHIKDSKFCNLFEKAITTSLSNEHEMKPWIDLFPLQEKGVPQGSSLSVFCANVALSGIDTELNTERLTTIRYLDDILILGKSKTEVDLAFGRVLEILRADGMDAYLPRDGSQKAWSGRVESGVDFLGCRVNSRNISPSRRANRALLDEIEFEVSRSKRAISNLKGHDQFVEGFPKECSVGATLARTSASAEGWSEAYKFCSNRLPFHQLQKEIDKIQRDYLGWSIRFSSRFHAKQWRQVWGGANIASVIPRRPIAL